MMKRFSGWATVGATGQRFGDELGVGRRGRSRRRRRCRRRRFGRQRQLRVAAALVDGRHPQRPHAPVVDQLEQFGLLVLLGRVQRRRQVNRSDVS